jgi:hypothetical protein
VLEAFRPCYFNGVSLREAYDADGKGGKFIADKFTRFVFQFQGGNFRLKKRLVLPNPDEEVKGYMPNISISE